MEAGLISFNQAILRHKKNSKEITFKYDILVNKDELRNTIINYRGTLNVF